MLRFVLLNGKLGSKQQTKKSIKKLQALIKKAYSFFSVPEVI